MKNKNKIFFLHIPKTAGSAFNRTFRGVVPSHRYFEHMESRRALFLEVIADGQPFFASGHFPFRVVRSLVTRPDVFSITILRDPLKQLISHMKWVKSYGDPSNPQRKATIAPAIAAVAEQLWSVSLNDVDALRDIVSTDIGRRLFDNLQTRYLSDPQVDFVDQLGADSAFESISDFDFVFTIEKYYDFLSHLKSIFPEMSTFDLFNESPLDELVDFKDSEVEDFYRSYTRYDELLYDFVSRYASEQFLGRIA